VFNTQEAGAAGQQKKMNNPFVEQNCFSHQAAAADRNTQPQQCSDTFSSWNANTNMMQQQQPTFQNDRALVPALGYYSSMSQQPALTITHDPIPPHSSQQQQQVLPASFDPFSPVTQPPSMPVNATSQQLVTTSQNSFFWALDHQPPAYNTTQPINQYPPLQQQPKALPEQKQEQQLAFSEWNNTQVMTTVSTNVNNTTPNNFVIPSVPLSPPIIQRSATPPPTARPAYNNSHTATATTTMVTRPTPYSNDSSALVTTTYPRSPPTSPPRDVSERQLQISQIISQQRSLPPDASPLPNPELVVSSGYVLSRISFRTILLKKWKQTYWAQYGPHMIFLFRSLADYQDWLTNPYHNAKMRDYLIKEKFDFLGDLSQPGVMGYQLTPTNRKGYDRGEPMMYYTKALDA